MLAWHMPRWTLPAALGGVLAMAAVNLVLMQRRPVSVRPQAMAETIGLRADAEGEGVRVQWDRGSRPIRNADHATLFIEDGKLKSQLDLTGRQLDGSSVLYNPESERVAFRLEVYRGGLSSSESAAFVVPGWSRHGQAGGARAVVEPLRPSPFERVEPEIVQIQMPPAPVVAPEAPPPEPAAAAKPTASEPLKRGRLDRAISKIPLLRRLSKHPQSDETEPR
jgi:hypothetical protein